MEPAVFDSDETREKPEGKELEAAAAESGDDGSDSLFFDLPDEDFVAEEEAPAERFFADVPNASVRD